MIDTLNAAKLPPTASADTWRELLPDKYFHSLKNRKNQSSPPRRRLCLSHTCFADTHTVVISLIQKGNDLKVKKGLLEDDTRKLLARRVLERLNRYETYRGEELTMDIIINRQAKEIAEYILGESALYKPYTPKW